MTPREILAARLLRQGSTQRALAREIGISEAYLSDILSQRREAGKQVLEYLGLERRVTYRKVK